MTLAERLHEARKLAGISALELGALAGLSGGYVGHIESGRRKNPGSGPLDGIARALGVSLEWLIRGKGQGPTEESAVAAVAAARRSHARRSKGAA
jgi:transcriptional regulator with XRE-family HTH domain